MTNEQATMLVLKDTAGNYFLLSRETLEQARATKVQQAELDAHLGGADTAGFSSAFRPEDLIVVGLAYPNQLLGSVPLPANAADVAEDLKPRR